MRKLVKQALSLALVVTMISASTPVLALTRVDRNKAEMAGSRMTGIMQIILDEYVGSTVTMDQLYEGAMDGMASTLDEYSVYMTKAEMQEMTDSLSGHFYGVGITYQRSEEDRFEVISVMSKSPAETAGILKGDFMTKIDGKEVKGLTAEQVSRLIVGNGSQEVIIEIERGLESKSFTIKKEELKTESVHMKKIEDILPVAKGSDNESIRYVKIDYIGEETADELKAAITRLKNLGVTDIILDLRSNGGGLMNAAIDISNQIVPEGPIFYTINKAGKKETIRSPLKEAPFKNIVIMTDGGTASAAELITAALQDAGVAQVVGQTSYGKGVIQSIYNIEDGSAFKLTTMEYLRRNGGKINKIGITPDVEIKLPKYVYDAIVLDTNNASPEVANVKEMLAYLGHKVGEAGSYYDEVTKASVIEFQKSNDLAVDGKLGYETIIKLDLAVYNYIAEKEPVLNKAYEMIKE